MMNPEKNDPPETPDERKARLEKLRKKTHRLTPPGLTERIAALLKDEMDAYPD
jgi:hypothetical protein